MTDKWIDKFKKFVANHPGWCIFWEQMIDDDPKCEEYTEDDYWDELGYQVFDHNVDAQTQVAIEKEIRNMKDPNSKKALRAELMEALRKQMKVKRVYQARPYTCVLIGFKGLAAAFMGEEPLAGFSKVSWPDGWKPVAGVDMAINHVLAYVARTIIAIEDGVKIAHQIIDEANQ